MNWRRALLITAGVVAAVAALGALLIAVRLDDIVRSLIERRGSALTGTPVQVEEVEIQLASGHATLRGLSIANPPGFSAPNALTLTEVGVGIDLRSLFSDPLVIDAVREVHPPFSPEAAIGQIAQLFKLYRVQKVTADRYAAEFPRELFQKFGISVVPSEMPASHTVR